MPLIFGLEPATLSLQAGCMDDPRQVTTSLPPAIGSVVGVPLPLTESASLDPDSIGTILTSLLGAFGSISTDNFGFFALLFLLASVFFSLAEGALLAFSPHKLIERLGPGSADRIEQYSANRDDMVVSAIIVDSSCNICFVACMTLWLTDIQQLSSVWGLLISIGVSIVAIIPTAEILPRIWGNRNSTAFLYRTLPFLFLLSRMLNPFVRACHAINRAIWRMLGHAESDGLSMIADEIQTLVDKGEQDGVLEEEAREMIESIIDFTDMDVNEIKTPRTSMVCISADATMDEAIALITEEQHSRIPVFQETRDQIVGILYARDLFSTWGAHNELRVRDVMRGPLFIPETKSALELLKEMKVHKTQMAVILDEYGGTDGLITFEDLLEEIVGEIDDEYDEEDEQQPFNRLDDGAAEVDASLAVDELAELMTITLPDNEHYETIGGLLFNEMGRIPDVGDEFKLDNVTFRVLEATDRKINRVRVTINPNGQSTAS